MNNENIDNTDNTDPRPADQRPLSYWLRTVDGLLTREFASALEREGITPRDWMLLNLLASDVDAPGVSERLARKGKRLRGLEDRGWAEQKGDGTWALTDTGRAEKERIAEIVDAIRTRMIAAVGDDAFASTVASLETIARELGWDESDPRSGFGFGFGGFPGGPGGRGRGFGGFRGPWPFRPEIHDGFGPNRHHGFGPGRPGRPGTTDDAPRDRDNAFDDGCRGSRPQGDYGHGGHGHGGYGHGGYGHDRGGHGRGGRHAQHAFERGFDAGFTRGRESGAA
jgi:hypothetical protein